MVRPFENGVVVLPRAAYFHSRRAKTAEELVLDRAIELAGA